MAQLAAIQSAETMAFLRAVVAREENLAVKSEDRFAKRFLGPKYRFLIRVSFQAPLRRILELLVPGSYGFTVARTRHFDEVLLLESRAGVEQLVLLGAGYDSRPFRFQDALGNVRIFEVDHPGTQARKRRMLEEAGESPANLRYIPPTSTSNRFRTSWRSTAFRPTERRCSCGRASPTTCRGRW